MMKKFFFRLETLLKLHKTRERRTQRELAYMEQKQTSLQAKSVSLEKQMAALIKEITIKRKAKEYGLEETYSQLLHYLNTSFSQTQEVLSLQDKQITEKKEQLKKMVQGRKIIEKIKENHYTDWRVEIEQREESLLDEKTANHSPFK
ncbi:MAG: flagellar export protein FliJ [Chlamydiales bacterium]